MTRRTFCVIYRSGGYARFTWRRSIPMSREDAYAKLAEVRTAGYAGHVEDFERSLALGLPETYEAGEIAYPATVGA